MAPVRIRVVAGYNYLVANLIEVVMREVDNSVVIVVDRILFEVVGNRLEGAHSRSLKTVDLNIQESRPNHNLSYWDY